MNGTPPHQAVACEPMSAEKTAPPVLNGSNKEEKATTKGTKRKVAAAKEGWPLEGDRVGKCI
jgi:hypothetical protein